MDDTIYYSELEQGARYLAGLALDDAERREHLGWANRYRQLALAAEPSRPALRLVTAG